MPLFQTTPMTLVIGVTLDWPNMPFWPFSFDLLHVHTGWNRRFRKKSSIPAQNRGVLGTFGTLFFFSASEVYTSSRNIVRFGAKENNASREVVETYWNGSTWNRRFWARIEYFSKKSPIPGQNRGGPNTFNMLWRYWTEMNWEQVDWFSAYSFSISSSCSNKMATICERYWKIFTLGHRNHFLEVICRDFRYAIGFTSSGREHIGNEKSATIWFRFGKIRPSAIENIIRKSNSVSPNMLLVSCGVVGNILVQRRRPPYGFDS